MVILAMALRAASTNDLAGAISWTASGLYCLAAQGVTVLSVIEIGPNLLAAITSIIGALVLLGQVYLAQRVKRTERHVESNTREAVKAKSRADDAQERVAEIERKVENGG